MQEKQAQEPYENYQPYPSSSMQNEPSDSFLKTMIEVEETISKFEMETLRRKRLHIDLKNKKKEWVPMAKGVDPICNELGIAELLGYLRGKATIICRLTKKYDDEIMRDMFQFHMGLIELIQLRADDWDLDEEMAKPLLEACVGMVSDIVFSARDGFTAQNIKSQYQRNENVTGTNENEGVRSILGLKVK